MLLKPSTMVIAAVATALLMGCGSASGQAHAFWSADTADEEKGKKPARNAEELTATPISSSEALTAWVGVRHDLMLAPSPQRKERCSCLAVEVGDPNDPRFQWVAGAPNIESDAVAIAVSARGVPCPGGDPDEEKRRPSISAVDQDGNDVTVEVEELSDGRPLASGAIIPKPQGGGAIYVKARNSKVPYAQPTSGALCKVY